MIKKIVSGVIVLILLAICGIPFTLFASEVRTNVEDIIYDPTCSWLGTYDDETMTLSGVYEDTSIMGYVKIFERNSPNSSVSFYKDSELVTGGNIEEGLIAKVYYNTECKEYTVLEVLKFEPLSYSLRTSSFDSSITTFNSNIYGFIYPLDNMNLNFAKNSDHPSGGTPGGTLYGWFDESRNGKNMVLLI